MTLLRWGERKIAQRCGRKRRGGEATNQGGPETVRATVCEIQYIKVCREIDAQPGRGGVSGGQHSHQRPARPRKALWWPPESLTTQQQQLRMVARPPANVHICTLMANGSLPLQGRPVDGVASGRVPATTQSALEKVRVLLFNEDGKRFSRANGNAACARPRVLGIHEGASSGRNGREPACAGRFVPAVSPSARSSFLPTLSIPD